MFKMRCLGSIPICAVSDVPIIGYGTRLNEYRSGQDVDKMARTVTVLDMLLNQVMLKYCKKIQKKIM